MFIVHDTGQFIYMNIFSKISTLVFFYCLINMMQLSEPLRIFSVNTVHKPQISQSSIRIFTSAAQTYDTDPPSHTPTPDWDTACFPLFLRLSGDNTSRRFL